MRGLGRAWNHSGDQALAEPYTLKPQHVHVPPTHRLRAPLALWTVSVSQALHGKIQGLAEP